MISLMCSPKVIKILCKYELWLTTLDHGCWLANEENKDKPVQRRLEREGGNCTMTNIPWRNRLAIEELTKAAFDPHSSRCFEPKSYKANGESAWLVFRAWSMCALFVSLEHRG